MMLNQNFENKTLSVAFKVESKEEFENVMKQLLSIDLSFFNTNYNLVELTKDKLNREDLIDFFKNRDNYTDTEAHEFFTKWLQDVCISNEDSV